MLNRESPPRPYDIDAVVPESHPSKKAKIAFWIVSASLLVAAFGIALMLFWALDTKPVLEVKNSPLPTRSINQNPTANGVVFLHANYCKRADVDGEVRMSFVGDSKEILTPVTQERGPVGCYNVETPIAIPKDITPGTYIIKFRITYNKNPLRQNEVVEFESQPITIDPTTP